MYRQIVYSSRANPETHEADLAEILRCSRRNNPELGITGVLILAGEGSDITYLQAIEGEPVHVDLVLDVIATDNRHTGFKMLLDHPVAHRAFADWSMGDMVVPPAVGGAAVVRDKVLAVLAAHTGPSARDLIAGIARAA